MSNEPDIPDITDEIADEELEAEAEHRYLISEDGEIEDELDEEGDDDDA